MRLTKYNFQWFEKEDRRRTLRASVGRDGRLRLGKTLRKALPQFIQVGFDPKVKVLAIADGHGAGIDCPKCGVMTAQALSAQISAVGLCLPVSFCLLRDESTGFFLGRVVPRRRKVAGTSKRQYDTAQLMILYQHIVDNAVSQLAKSTPFSERKAFAVEAFCAAVEEYQPGYGDLETYLEEHISGRLVLENKQYTAAYYQRSLDQPISSQPGNSFCLYDTLDAAASGGIDAIEEQMMEEEFWETLTAQERKLSGMLRDGFLLAEIAEELEVTQERVMEVGQVMGQKRRQFYGAD